MNIYITTDQSQQQLLQKFETLIKIQTPILIVGPPCSGRLTLAKYGSEVITGKPPLLLNIQTATDCREALGQFGCSRKPGVFVFREGILSTAMREGRCIIIRNAGKLHVDVFSGLYDVIETLIQGKREINVYGRMVQINSGFRLLGICEPGDTLLRSGIGQNFFIVETMPHTNEQIQSILISKTGPAISLLLPGISRQFNLNLKHLMKLAWRLQYDIDTGILVLNNAILTNAQQMQSDELMKAFINSLSQQSRLIIMKELLEVWGQNVECIEQQKKRLIDLSLFFQIEHKTLLAYIQDNPPQIQFNSEQQQLRCGRFLVDTKMYNYSGKKVSFNIISELEKRSVALTSYTSHLLQKIVASVVNNENLLLFSTTGVGKTFTLELAAKLLGNKLVVINLSSQTDIQDLVGGYKPVTLQNVQDQLQTLADQLVAELLDMSVESNKGFYQQLKDLFKHQHCQKATSMLRMLIKQLQQQKHGQVIDQSQQLLIQKTIQLLNLHHELVQTNQTFCFSHYEGPLVEAAQRGYFVLFDEINLASTEVHQFLSNFLSSGELSVPDASGQCDIAVQKHRHFRAFAGANPTGEAGRRKLPESLLEQFTIQYIQEPFLLKDLQRLETAYLGTEVQRAADLFVDLKQIQPTLQTAGGKFPTFSIRSYCRAMRFAKMHWHLKRSLFDGFKLFFTTGLDENSYSNVNKLLVEKLNVLSYQGEKFIPNLSTCPFLYQNSVLLNVDGHVHFPAGPRFRGNPNAEALLDSQNNFVITDANKRYVQQILLSLLSGTSVLLEGPTSAGKSSIVTFLADLLGYELIRINNHENIDLQDYLGSYQPDSEGHLRFQEGPLVRGLRNGAWILLDELNLCPSEVLEALNRLLDDNKELQLADSGQYLSPSPGFALFATQNPAGLVNGVQYGGRRKLSEAFRNRFVVMQLEELTAEEIEFIISRRAESSSLPPTFTKKLMSAVTELKLTLGHLLQGQNDSDTQTVTLRDVFRIADRQPATINELAIHVFMLLGERQRTQSARDMIEQCIKKYIYADFNVIQVQNYYQNHLNGFKSLFSNDFGTTKRNVQDFAYIAQTIELERALGFLLCAFKNSEGVCLVGHFGSGKTQSVELAARLNSHRLCSVALHKGTDVSDLVGALRPPRVRCKAVEVHSESQKTPQNCFSYQNINKYLKNLRRIAFCWQPGPLLESVTSGGILLLDEANLCGPAVLERLNSVLEAGRGGSSLTLAELPAAPSARAIPACNIACTMNPAGDFGKRELSPALRSRLAEIFIPPPQNKDQIAFLLKTRLNAQFRMEAQEKQIIERISEFLGDFFGVIYTDVYAPLFPLSVRDLVAAAELMASSLMSKDSNESQMNEESQNTAESQSKISPKHLLRLLDVAILRGIGLRMGFPPKEAEELRQDVIKRICKLYSLHLENEYGIQVFGNNEIYEVHLSVDGVPSLQLCINGDIIAQCSAGTTFNVEKAKKLLSRYCLSAPTTFQNAVAVFNALKHANGRALLLEAAPGTGKTSLIEQLAGILGYPLVRVNLSEHLDLADLLGADLPSGGQSSERDGNIQSVPTFTFSPGPVTIAVQSGAWLLLDELNLASQTVLEGLNSLLDHRKQLFIPETGQTIHAHPNFRLFTAQNPSYAGGGRKRLPQSFISRFLAMGVQELNVNDYNIIVQSIDSISEGIKQILLCSVLESQKHLMNVMHGGPWEVNLRDIYRSVDAISLINQQWHDFDQKKEALMQQFVQRIIMYQLISRYRVIEDVNMMATAIVNGLKNIQICILNQQYPMLDVENDVITIGCIRMKQNSNLSQIKPIQPSNSPLIEQMLIWLNIKTPILLVSSGEYQYIIDQGVDIVSSLLSQEVMTISLSKSTDVSDLIGQYQQFDKKQYIHEICEDILTNYNNYIITAVKKHPETRNDQKVDLENIKDNILSIMTLNKVTHQEEYLENSTATQYEHSDETVQQICNKIQNVLSQMRQLGVISESVEENLSNHVIQLSRNELDGKFVWQDGPVVSAMKLGLILHLKNVNMCSAAVLDRLNPLLERGGQLTIFERGIGSQIALNKNNEANISLQQQMNLVNQSQNFKVILSYDPYFGEVSPAIRNRSQQICIDMLELQSQIIFGTSFQQLKYELASQQESFKVSDTSLQAKMQHIIRQIDYLPQQMQFEILQHVFQDKVEKNTLYPQAFQLINSVKLGQRAISNVIMQQTEFKRIIASLQALSIKQYDSGVLKHVIQIILGVQLDDKSLNNIRDPYTFIELIRQYRVHELHEDRFKQMLLTILSSPQHTGALILCQVYHLMSQQFNRQVVDHIILLLWILKQLYGRTQQQEASNEILLLVDQFYMERQITMFQKQLLSHLIEPSHQNIHSIGQWEQIRNNLSLSALKLHRSVINQANMFIENNGISIQQGVVMYKKEDILKYLQFQFETSSDPLLKLTQKQSHQMMKDSLIYASLINHSTYLSKNQDALIYNSILKNNLVCQSVVKNISAFYKIYVNNSEQIQNILKNQFNMLKLQSSRILKAKYDVVSKLFINICKYEQVLNGQMREQQQIQVTDMLDLNMILQMFKKAANILQKTDFSNQIDPSLFYGKQQHIINISKQELTESISTIKNLQIILESRITDDYFKDSELVQMINTHIQQLQTLLDSTGNISIVREDNAEDYYVDLQFRLQNVGINQVEELYMLLQTNLVGIMQYYQQNISLTENQQKQKYQIKLKIQQVIASFNSFIVDCLLPNNVENAGMFVDCILPVVYAMLSITFILLHVIEILKLMEPSNVSGANLYLRSIYGLETPVLFRQYIHKFYPKLRQSVDIYLCNYLSNTHLGLSIGDYINIASEYTGEQLESFAKSIKSCSLFKTQSQSTSDTEAYKQEFEEQIMIIFGNQQRQLTAEQTSSLEAGRFISKIGFIMLQQYIEGLHVDDNLVEQLQRSQSLEQLHHMSSIFETLCRHEVKQDSIFYLHNLALIRRSFDKLHHDLSENMQTLLRVKSHKQRRSAVCQNIHLHAYPSEVFNFQATILSIKVHAQNLLKEYAETAILMQIVETCDNYLNFQFIAMPLGKCLLILELLAQQMTQWDTTSPKVLNFSENQQKELKNCIIRWRRLEVMGWSSFFTDVAIEFISLAVMQWPQLLLSSVQAAKSGENQLSEDFSSHIYTYIGTGMIGEASWRQKMLLALISALNELPVDASLAQMMIFKASVINERFLAQIQAQIDNGRKSIFKDFTSQVQLFQWRERTFERDSKKAHTAVAKLVRRYKEIQQQEMSAFIAQLMDSDYVIKPFNTQQLMMTQSNKQAQNPQNITDAQQLMIEVMQILSDFHTEQKVQNQQQLMLRSVIKHLNDFLDIDKLNDEDIKKLKIMTSDQAIYNLLPFKDKQTTRLLLSYYIKFEQVIQKKHRDIQGGDFVQIKIIVAQLIIQAILYTYNQQENYKNNVGYNYKLRQIFNITNMVYDEIKYVFNNQIEDALKTQIEELLKQAKTKISTQQIIEYNKKILLVINNLINQHKYDVDVLQYQKQIIQENISTLTQLGDQTTTLKAAIVSYQQKDFIISQQNALDSERQEIIGKVAYKLIDCFACIISSGYKSKKKQDEQEDGKQTKDNQQQPQDGVGLGNAKGEEDITNQVKEEDLSEDQLIGNQNEQDDDQDNASSKDTGIDLSNDFGGHQHGVDQGEEGEEASEKTPESDFGSQDLEKPEEEDKRQADVDESKEMSHNADRESTDNVQNEQLQAGENQGEEQTEASENQQNEQNNQEDKPEVFPEFPSIDDDLEAFEEINDQNVSGQSEEIGSDFSDHQISDLFDEVFKSDIQEEDQQNSSEQISIISEIEQKFEERAESENGEEINEQTQNDIEIEQKNQAVEDELQFNQAQDENQEQDKGFGDGDNAGANNFNEEKLDNEDKLDKIPEQQENQEKEEQVVQNDKDEENEVNQKQKLEQKSVDKQNKSTNKNKDFQCANNEMNEENEEDENYQTRNKRNDSKELLKNKDSKQDANVQDDDQLNIHDNEEAEEVDDAEQNSQQQEQPTQNQIQHNQDVLEDKNLFIEDENTEEVANREMFDDNLEETQEGEAGGVQNVTELWDREFSDKKLQTSINSASERLKAALEPLTMSGLVGDFRTGKRLNMRRVVGFVASGYRNDKIWLRRSLPQRRDYRIIVAVDNSMSVVDRGVAAQTIRALIILQAAVRLAELGTLCLLSFGKDVETLLEFTDAHHNLQIKALSKKLTFNEKQSNFDQLFKKVREIYDALPDDENPQKNIFICITDGQVQNRDSVSKSYKGLLDAGIVPVVVINDKKIFDQKTIQFVAGKDGKRVIKKTPYLEDNYPFSNYTVCDVVNESLGDALCSLLLKLIH